MVRRPGFGLAREVHEETGWMVDPCTLRSVGWLYFTYRTAVAPEYERYPHPDFIHAVFTAEATERDVAQGDGWVDTEGYVIGSRVVAEDEALAVGAGRALERVLLERALGHR